MNKIFAIIGLLFITGALFFSAQARADIPQDFQLSFINPVQLHPSSDDIEGFRFNLIYGFNMDMQGLDLGLINQVKHDFTGLQVGLVNLDDRSAQGVQIGVLFNEATEEMHGLQVGLINHTGSLQGIQIGLLNFNDDTKYLGFFPFINAAF